MMGATQEVEALCDASSSVAAAHGPADGIAPLPEEPSLEEAGPPVGNDAVSSNNGMSSLGSNDYDTAGNAAEGMAVRASPKLEEGDADASRDVKDSCVRDAKRTPAQPSEVVDEAAESANALLEEDSNEQKDCGSVTLEGNTGKELDSKSTFNITPITSSNEETSCLMKSSTVAHPVEVVRAAKPQRTTIMSTLDLESRVDDGRDAESRNEVDQQYVSVANERPEVGDENDEFVAIELASPKQSVGFPMHTVTERVPIDGDFESDFVAAEAAAADSSNANPTAITSTNTYNINGIHSHHPNLQQQPRRRKILCHPILTPLTKLPWDRLASAAGSSCDLLFNCRYSMRQVEDEVREEHRRRSLLYADERNDGRGEDQDCSDRNDGYVNVSLGNECGQCQYDEQEEGCDADELAEMGLDCCSMLDVEVEDNEEVEVIMNKGLLWQLPPGDSSEDGHWEQVKNIKDEGGGRNAHNSSLFHNEEVLEKSSPSAVATHDIGGLLSDEQRAEASWKNSNPSLQMMLYRTMIHD